MAGKKKIDTTTLIGMILMGAILMYMSYQNRNLEEKLEEKNTTQLTTTTTPESPDQENAFKANPNDSIAVAALQNKLGVFAYSSTLPSASDGYTEIKNDVLELKIANKGGYIVEAKLPQHTTYDGKPIYLINEGNNLFNISFTTTDNRVLNTKDLYFEPELTQQGDQTVLVMRLKAGPSQFIAYRYVLKPGEYMLDFGLQSQGLSSVFNASQPMRLQWDFKGYRHAKSIEYENRYTKLAYMFEDQKTDDLSPAGDDSEVEKDIKWLNYRQHFFSSMLITDVPFSEGTLTSTDLFKQQKDKETEGQFTKEYKADLSLTAKNGELNYAMQMYYGPSDYKILKTYDNNLTEALPLGWGIFGVINKYLIIPFFDLLTGFLPAGIAIIVMTILIKLLLSPVQYKQYLSQAKMKVIRPEITEINEKYKKNAMKKQQETMALYGKAGVNPAAGCLPALLQIPIFYALFTFFPSAFDLRGKSFLWVDDLSSYDEIAKLPFNIPFYGDHISLFPLLAAITIFFSTRLTSSQQMASTPTQEGMPDMAKMMKYMMYFMPVMMLFFFNNYASGLSLYYFISNLITIILIVVIKNYIIDEDKVHALIQANKAKPKKQNKFQRKMKEMMEAAEKQQNATKKK